MYDLNGDNRISRDEMMQWLKSSLVRQSHEDDTDEGVKELVEIIMRKLDCIDHDNRVSFQVISFAICYVCLFLLLILQRKVNK